MTRKGLVNTGVLAVKQPLLPDNVRSKKVIIIGAGPSGLAAARQLQNFGTQVNILDPYTSISAAASVHSSQASHHSSTPTSVHQTNCASSPGSSSTSITCQINSSSAS
ncbi:hypothetical protein ILYODFUR_038539 [Ilyodon furcidens]|uniref:Alanine dehydrogenase/pyridine nucleotide transhydrogenase NAD(H)-binding domain-containing protein n=1 Tax=Ilyodon furcidens TaxID=33524 RepID=A0ABV0T3S7_9TELE